MKFDNKSLKNVINNLRKYEKKKLASIDSLGRVSATHMENHAKQNKPWNNQTGNAQKGLNGFSFWETPTLLHLGVYHTMPYGLWLELANGREYAILEQSRNIYANDFLNEVKKVMME